MNELTKLINICEAYKKGQYEVQEFQKRIETVYLPDECKNTLEKEQHNAFNKLEEILFCYNESQKQYALKVADSLIEATLLEKKRLTKNASE